MDEYIIVLIVLVLFVLFLILCSFELFFRAMEEFNDVFLTRYGKNSVKLVGTIVSVEILGALKSTATYPVIRFEHNGTFKTLVEEIHGGVFFKKDVGNEIKIYYNPLRNKIFVDYINSDSRAFRFIFMFIASFIIWIISIIIIIFIKDGLYLNIKL